jgi:hypothetical protein
MYLLPQDYTVFNNDRRLVSTMLGALLVTLGTPVISADLNNYFVKVQSRVQSNSSLKSRQIGKKNEILGIEEASN